MIGRFCSLKYDSRSAEAAELLKRHFENLEVVIDDMPESRPKSLCLTALEEAFMWAGKAIRDEQVKREGSHD